MAVSEASGKPAGGGRRLGVEVTGKVDNFLARVDAALVTRGMPTEERRGIVAELRNQIMAKLAARPGNSAGDVAADLSQILAEVGAQGLADGEPLARASPSGASPAGVSPTNPGARGGSIDPPGARASAASPIRTTNARLSLTALGGALWAPFFFILVSLSSVSFDLKPGEAAPVWQPIVPFVLLPLGLAAPLATTVMGLLALGQIPRSGGKQYGLSLALFDAMLYPLAVLDFVVFYLFVQIHNSLVAQDYLPDAVSNVIFRQALPTIICVLGDYFLVTRAWAVVKPARKRRGRRGQ